MTPATFVLLSGVLTYGVPLGLAIRELMVLRPSSAGGDEPPPPPPPRVPRAPRPLPDCLQPERLVARTPDAVVVRTLEDA